MFTAHKGFKNEPRGFQITYENGNTISVMFGAGNYCNVSKSDESKTESTSAEIAIWNSSGDWYNFDGTGNVLGWQSPADVLKWQTFAATTTF